MFIDVSQSTKQKQAVQEDYCTWSVSSVYPGENFLVREFYLEFYLCDRSETLQIAWFVSISDISAFVWCKTDIY